MRKLLLPAALLFVLSACLPKAQVPTNAPPPSARGGYTFDLSDQSIKPSTPMIAKPISAKLFVIIDAAQAEDAFLIDNSTHGVKGFRTFLEDSLRNTLSAFFSDMSFVEPGYTFPSTPHFVAQAKVDRISANNIRSGFMEHAILQMNWAFAIRPSTHEEFSFSFSGVAKSEVAYHTLYIGCQQLMHSAMNGLLQAWANKDVFAKLASPVPPGKPTPAKITKKVVLAIFDIHDASRKLDKETLDNLTLFLGTLLVQQGKFNVIPRDQVRARLRDEKKGSYRQCIDESCQIDLGKALAAQKTLSTVLIKIGEKCVLTSTLFDLKSETAQEGATVETTCKNNELLAAMKLIAAQL